MTLLDLALPYQKRILQSTAKVKVLNQSRQSGKSWVAAFSAVKKACSKPNLEIVYLSTGQRAADDALRTCLKFCEAVKELSNNQITYSANASAITLSNGSRITSLPCSPVACRGKNVSLLLLDEIGFWQNAAEMWEAIVPTLTNKLANKDKQLIICSTPSGKNNIFYELCQKAKSTDGWEYFEVTIEDAIREGLKADVDELKKLIDDPMSWRQEFMCEFSDSSNALFDVNLLQTYSSDVKFLDYFMGVDFGRTHDATCITVIGRDRTNKYYLCDLQKLNGVEYAKQFNIIKTIFQKYNPKCCYCDAGGLGGPLAEELNRQVSARIKGITFNQTNKNEMFEFLRKVVFDRQFFVNADFQKLLKQELQMVRQIISDNGKTSYVAERVHNSHADSVSALILALHAIHKNPVNASAPVTYMPFSVF